jgi:hypothetical protein
VPSCLTQNPAADGAVLQITVVVRHNLWATVFNSVPDLNGLVGGTSCAA